MEEIDLGQEFDMGSLVEVARKVDLPDAMAA
jgi:hypothetical protein